MIASLSLPSNTLFAIKGTIAFLSLPSQHFFRDQGHDCLFIVTLPTLFSRPRARLPLYRYLPNTFLKTKGTIASLSLPYQHFFLDQGHDRFSIVTFPTLFSRPRARSLLYRYLPNTFFATKGTIDSKSI